MRFMYAAIHTRYGPPEVVSVREIPVPQPRKGQTLIKVHASTVNRTDSGFRSAEYFVSRFFSGLFRPKYRTLGCEFAGIVEAAGSGSTWKPGDRVFGYDDACFGGHAAYKLAGSDTALAHIPDGFTFEEVVASTEGCHYALSNIRAAKVRKGDRVMVYGATGAIGSAAVQLLKYFGAEVVAVANTKNMELVRNLGADVVIDYQKQNFTETGGHFSFIFDAVGKSSFAVCKPLLGEKGIYVSTEPGRKGENIPLALWTLLLGGRKVLFPIPRMTSDILSFIRERLIDGSFRPVIDRSYPLDRIVDAYRYVGTGQKTGNVILNIT